MITLTIKDDFDLAAIADSGQCFRACALADGWFRMVTGEHALYIRSLGKHLFEARCSELEWESVWIPYFDLRRDYRSIRRSIPKSDIFLYRAAKEGAGIRILRQDPWETAVSFLISQRKSIPAIRSCIEKLCKNFGHPIPNCFGETLYSFADAHAIAQADNSVLKSCSLGYRLPYLKSLASKIESEPDFFLRLNELPDEELLFRLRELYGIGIKVSSCIALFAYGRTSVAPVDTWISRIITQKYDCVNPFASCKENAGILQQYAFRYAIRHKEDFRIDNQEDS